MNEKVSFGKELKRKILHLMAMSAAIVWLYALEDCFWSVLTALFLWGLLGHRYLDTIGSVLVSVYMIWCGIRTIRENRK